MDKIFFPRKRKGFKVKFVLIFLFLFTTLFFSTLLLATNTTAVGSTGSSCTIGSDVTCQSDNALVITDLGYKIEKSSGKAETVIRKDTGCRADCTTIDGDWACHDVEAEANCALDTPCSEGYEPIYTESISSCGDKTLFLCANRTNLNKLDDSDRIITSVTPNSSFSGSCGGLNEVSGSGSCNNRGPLICYNTTTKQEANSSNKDVLTEITYSVDNRKPCAGFSESESKDWFEDNDNNKHTLSTCSFSQKYSQLGCPTTLDDPPVSSDKRCNSYPMRPKGEEEPEDLCTDLGGDYRDDGSLNNSYSCSGADKCCGDELLDYGYISPNNNLLCSYKTPEDNTSDFDWIAASEQSRFGAPFNIHPLPSTNAVSNGEEWWVCDANNELNCQGLNPVEEYGSFPSANIVAGGSYLCPGTNDQYYRPGHLGDDCPSLGGGTSGYDGPCVKAVCDKNYLDSDEDIDYNPSMSADPQGCFYDCASTPSDSSNPGSQNVLKRKCTDEKVESCLGISTGTGGSTGGGSDGGDPGDDNGDGGTGTPIGGGVIPVPDRKNSSFMCYQRQGENYFAECCSFGSCENTNLIPPQGALFSNRELYSFGLGSSIQSVATFDIADKETKSMIDYVKVLTDIKTDGFTFFSTSGAKANFSGFEYLDFQVLFDKPGSRLVVESETGDVVFNGSLSKYLLDGSAPLKWHHARIPLSEFSSRKPFSFSIKPIGETTSYAFDNFLLKNTTSNSPNSENRYCSGVFGKWLEDMDPPESVTNFSMTSDHFSNWGPYKYVCDYQLSYGWTGTQCCGDDLSDIDTPYNDTEAGCFKGTAIPSSSVAGEVKMNDSYNNLLYADGEFHTCHTDEYDSFIDDSIRTNNEVFDVVSSKFCSADGSWIDLGGPGKLKFIATKLYDTAKDSDDYTIHCGEREAVLDMPNILSDSSYPPSKLCAMELEGQPVVALETDSAKEFLGNVQTYIPFVDSRLEKDISKDGCDSVTNEDEFLESCGLDDLEVYYNKNYNIAVASPSSVSGLESNFVKDLWDAFLGLFTYFESGADKTSSFIAQEDFERIYLAKKGDLEVRGVGEGNSTVIHYQNFVTHISNLTEYLRSELEYDIEKAPNNTQVLEVNTSLDTGFETWRFLTSSLRLGEVTGTPVQGAVCGDDVIDRGEVCEPGLAPNVNICSEDQRDADVCPTLYEPVCGFNRTSSFKKTYNNGCRACSDRRVVGWILGSCDFNFNPPDKIGDGGIDVASDSESSNTESSTESNPAPPESCQDRGYLEGSPYCDDTCGFDYSYCACLDEDGDGYGVDCYDSSLEDCDDSNSDINPGASERCNGVDDNCDGTIDEDDDGDGDGYTVCDGDCDDTNSSINPDASEVCNGVDDNCDGTIDEGFDNDGDGYTTCGGDCDDTNSSINPNAQEVCGNNVDDNCNGDEDEGCAVTQTHTGKSWVSPDDLSDVSVEENDPLGYFSELAFDSSNGVNYTAGYYKYYKEYDRSADCVLNFSIMKTESEDVVVSDSYNLGNTRSDDCDDRSSWKNFPGPLVGGDYFGYSKVESDWTYTTS